MAQTIAREEPVLPPVHSTTRMPGAARRAPPLLRSSPAPSNCNRQLELVRYVIQVRLQLCEIEALCKPRLLSLRRQDRIGFVHALIPPSPCALLNIPPGQHGYLVLVVSHGVDSMAIIRQRARCPRFVIVEVLNAVLLHLESDVDAAEHLSGLLHVCMVFRVDL